MYALSALLTACSQPVPPPDKVDVVLVVVDTLRRDHTEVYGYSRPTTPALSALAAQGVRYDRAVSAAPWTLPSVTATLTGELPSTLGVVRHDSLVPDDALLISEVFSEAGWTTGAVTSHSFFSPDHNLQQGFSVFDTRNIAGHRAETSAGVTDAVLRFLRRNPGEAVFVVAHYFDPHFAYLAHEGHTFDGPDYDGPIRSGLPIKKLRALAPALTASDHEALRRLYDSEVAHTDHHIGRLLDALEARGPERTLVIVTHDHGESFMEHGHMGHTTQLYGELIDAPLVVRYPAGVGPAPGTVVSERVSLMDLPRTIASVAGLDASAFSGHSLLSPAPDRVVQSETLKGADLRAVVGPRHKLIWNRKTDRRQLFDLEADPGEQHALSAQPSSPEVEALQPLLHRWGPSRASQAAALSEEAQERLRALGYIDEP